MEQRYNTVASTPEPVRHATQIGAFLIYSSTGQLPQRCLCLHQTLHIVREFSCLFCAGCLALPVYSRSRHPSRATPFGPIIHILTYAHYYQHWIMRIPHVPQHHTDAILYQSRQSTKRNMKINCFYIDKLKMSKPVVYLTKKWSNLKLLLL